MKDAARPPTSTFLDYDTHVPIILFVLRKHREHGILLVSYNKFKKRFKAQCDLGTTRSITFKKFLIEASKEGAFLFLRSTTGSYASYLKLPDP